MKEYNPKGMASVMNALEDAGVELNEQTAQDVMMAGVMAKMLFIKDSEELVEDFTSGTEELSLAVLEKAMRL